MGLPDHLSVRPAFLVLLLLLSPPVTSWQPFSFPFSRSNSQGLSRLKPLAQNPHENPGFVPFTLGPGDGNRRDLTQYVL